MYPFFVFLYIDKVKVMLVYFSLSSKLTGILYSIWPVFRIRITLPIRKEYCLLFPTSTGQS